MKLSAAREPDGSVIVAGARFLLPGQGREGCVASRGGRRGGARRPLGVRSQRMDQGPPAPTPEPHELRLGMALSELGRLTTRPTVRADGPTQGRLQKLCAALTIASEIRIVPHVVSTYTDLLAGLHWGEIQLAWLPPMVALRAISRGSAV